MTGLHGRKKLVGSKMVNQSYLLVFLMCSNVKIEATNMSAIVLDSVIQYFLLSRVRLYCPISANEIKNVKTLKTITLLETASLKEEEESFYDFDSIFCLPNETIGINNTYTDDILKIVEKSRKSVFLCSNQNICIKYMDEIKLSVGHMAYFYNFASQKIYETYWLRPKKHIVQCLGQTKSSSFYKDGVSIIKSRNNLYGSQLSMAMETNYPFFSLNEGFDLEQATKVKYV